jgi:hypothetical protein
MNKTGIYGLKELQKVFKQLPNDIKDKEVRKELRRQYRPVQRAAQNLAGKKTGNLSRSIRFKDGKEKRDAVDIWLGAQNKSRKASHWYIVHEGTALRKVDSYKTKPSVRARLVTTETGERALPVSINGRTVMITNTGTMPAKKYIDNASAVLQGVQPRVAAAMEKRALAKAERLIQKYNLKR